MVLGQLIFHFLMDMLFAPLPVVCAPRSLFTAQVCVHVDGFGNRDKYLTSWLLKLGYRCHELRGAFSRFYY